MTTFPSMQRLFFLALATLALHIDGPTASAQRSSTDLRELHSRVAHATVLVRVPQGSGSGWLLAQSGRPVVITNKHVVARTRTANISFYTDSERPPVTIRATVWHRARDIDLAILRLDADPPPEAEPLQMRTDVNVVRGQRVVLGGNPFDAAGGILPFQTTEGVVTGHASGTAYDECGRGRNCIVSDAASIAGSSGGPAFNTDSQLVGMLWGGPVQGSRAAGTVVTTTNTGVIATSAAHAQVAVHNPTLAFLIHTRVIAEELQRLQSSPPPAPNVPAIQ